MRSEIDLEGVNKVLKNMLGRAMGLKRRDKRISSVMFEGGAGIGKTDVIRSYANNIGIPISKVDAMNFNTPGDFAGALKIVDGKSTNAPRVEFSKLLSVKEGDAGILLMDDVRRLHKQLLQEAMDLIMYGQIGPGLYIPNNVIVVLTSNPASGMYSGNRFDPAQSSRMVTFYVKPSVVGWLKWGMKNGINDRVLDFIAEFPDELHNSLDDSKNPRMWTLLSDAIKTHSTNEEIVASIIGSNLPENHLFNTYYFDYSNRNKIGIREIAEWLKDGDYNSVIDALKKARLSTGGLSEVHRLLRIIVSVSAKVGVSSRVTAKIFTDKVVTADMLMIYITGMADIKGFSGMVTDPDLAERIRKDNIIVGGAENGKRLG